MRRRALLSFRLRSTCFWCLLALTRNASLLIVIHGSVYPKTQGISSFFCAKPKKSLRGMLVQGLAGRQLRQERPAHGTGTITTTFSYADDETLTNPTPYNNVPHGLLAKRTTPEQA